MSIQTRTDDYGGRDKPLTRMETNSEVIDRLAASRRDERGRFSPGSSGNPKGPAYKTREPKMPGLLGAVMRELDKEVTVVGRGGKRKRIKRVDLVAARLVDDLIGDDSPARTRAMRLLISLGMPDVIERVEQWRAAEDEEREREMDRAIQAVEEHINRQPLELFGYSESDRQEVQI